MNAIERFYHDVERFYHDMGCIERDIERDIASTEDLMVIVEIAKVLHKTTTQMCSSS